jgi:HEAT repeat protein
LLLPVEAIDSPARGATRSTAGGSNPLPRVIASATTALIVGLALLVGCRGKTPGPDIAALIADLQSPDPEVSGKANLTLIRVGEPAVPALVELLKSEDARLRARAATTLWGMGSKGKAGVPALALALTDSDLDVRLASAMALEGMGPDAKEAMLALVRALKDREGRVRQWAAKALGKIGPAAKDALPALVEASKYDPIRPAVEEAISQIRAQPPPNPP